MSRARPGGVDAAGALTELRTENQQHLRTIGELTGEVQRRRGDIPPNIRTDLENASVEGLLAYIEEVRASLEQRLLTPPAAMLARYPFARDSEVAGVTRIVPLGKYEGLLRMRGGGAHWSFVSRSHSYDKEPDLELTGDFYYSGFTVGNEGWFLPLGDLRIEEVPDDATRTPAGLDPSSASAWRALWEDVPNRGRDRAGHLAEKTKGTALQRRKTKAVSRTTYALRSVLAGEHDVLVAFRCEEVDTYGHTLVWRLLRRFDLERPR